MKTENLVEALVADHATSRGLGRKPMRGSLAIALALGALVSLVVFLMAGGVRPDIAAALRTWRFDGKVVLVLVALALAFSLCLSLSRPLVPGRPGLRLLVLAALALAAVAIELALVPQAAWKTRLIGSNSLVCLTLIPILSLAPLAAVLAILRTAAPASPALAGAAAGLLAAAAGAALYAFKCFDDSPLFVVTWYSLAAIPVVALGAIVGHRLLRW